jgi:hypothetical protein
VDRPDDHDLLRKFLAERDAPCPSCRYNLRGVVGDKCPECARPLVLGVVTGGPPAALTWFLLLAFGWVFAAGTMNSIRFSQTIWIYTENVLAWGFTPGRPNLGAPVPLRPPDPVGAGFWQTAWDSVPAMTWAGAAWSYMLALGAGIGLLLMFHRRTAPFGPAGDRRMVILACGLFSIYVSWHFANFFLDMM